MNVSHQASTIPIAKVIALALFTISARAWLHSSTRRRRSSNSVLDQDNDDTQGNLGSRGTLSLKKTTPSYWSDFLKCLQNPCDPITNPDGHIALCLAENKLVQENLALRLMENPGTAINAFSDSIVYSYNGFLGLVQARESVAYFLERWILKTDVHVINCDNIALAAGVGSLISNVLYLISDGGDVVLIPAPYYTGYDHQAKAIASCKPWPVYMKNPLLGPDKEDLERAAKLAEKVTH